MSVVIDQLRSELRAIIEFTKPTTFSQLVRVLQSHVTVNDLLLQIRINPDLVKEFRRECDQLVSWDAHMQPEQRLDGLVAAHLAVMAALRLDDSIEVCRLILQRQIEGLWITYEAVRALFALPHVRTTNEVKRQSKGAADFLEEAARVWSPSSQSTATVGIRVAEDSDTTATYSWGALNA